MRDFTLLGFVEHLAKAAIEVAHADHVALDKASKLIQDEAKASIGTYQDQAGPFAAWAELAESTKDDRVRQGYAENEPELRTEALRNSIERTVHHHDADIGSNSEVMEFQELGTKNMPPRSILGGAAVRKTPEVVALIGAEYYAALTGEQVFEKALAIR